MLSRIHDKLGTAGLVIAVIALVAALAGTAIAAAGLNGKQKKEVKNIAKQFAGKNGAPGATGPQGPKGDTGAAGKNGTNGTNGTNGNEGPPGKDGKTGFTKTLPTGETETGTWALYPMGGRVFKKALSEEECTTREEAFPCFEITYSEGEVSMVAMPLNIPLNSAPEVIVYNKPGTEECPGSLAEPKAAAGKFCVYVEGAVFPTDPKGVKRFGGNDHLTVAGATVGFFSQERGKFVWGTYAVTAK
jgi:Collagen triple helix repeat (20 copies)